MCGKRDVRYCMGSGREGGCLSGGGGRGVPFGFVLCGSCLLLLLLPSEIGDMLVSLGLVL